MFTPGQEVVCVKSGADAPNPWHRAHPLTLGKVYIVLDARPYFHADGTQMEDMIAVDRSGRLWNASMFRPLGKVTDIDFAYRILAKANRKIRVREGSS